MNDIRSRTIIDIYSRKGNLLGKSGKGMFEAFKNLRDLDLIQVLQNSNNMSATEDQMKLQCFPTCDRNQFGKYVGTYDKSLIRFAIEACNIHIYIYDIDR